MHWTATLSLYGAAILSTVVALETNTSDIVPGAYIVEFAENHDTNSFIKAFNTSEVDLTVRVKLDYKLFKGVSIQLKGDSDIEAAAESIAGMGQVKRIWPVETVKLPNDTVIWSGSDHNLAGNSLRKRQTRNGTDAYSPHVMTQVDRLHAEGVSGKGIKIAVVDSGIDYTHPLLGGCFGPGCLVTHGKKYFDEQGKRDCVGHGTHVAGIIAARANDFGFLGGAPDVTLGDYNVFGCSGNVGNDVLVAAFNQAYEDGSDIITASLGSWSNWPENPVSAAVQRIVEAGVPCTISAGNDAGLLLTSAPANARGATAVASVDNTQKSLALLEASYSTSNSSKTPFGWVAGMPNDWNNASLPLWALQYSWDEPSQECFDFQTDVPDLSQRIVLLWVEACYIDVQINYVLNHGARFILFYSKTPGDVGPIEYPVPGIEAIGMITPEQGAEWLKLLSQNVTVTANMIDMQYANTIVLTEANTETGGFASRFTSWGPTLELDFKPQIAAPGGFILSTYPVELGGYAAMSGTSMAAPLMAAIYALIIEVRGTLDPATLNSLVSATANPNLFHDGKAVQSYLAPAAQQGAGLVQAYDAAHSSTLLSVSGFSFNDTDHFVSEANFTIKNLGSNEVTYSISHVSAATIYTLGVGSAIPLGSWERDMTTEGASITFDSDKITVPGGGEAVVTLIPTEPALDGTRLPIYSGYIALNATSGESLSIPYLGMQGSFKNATVVDDSFVLVNDQETWEHVTPNQTFTIPKQDELDPSRFYPVLQIQYAQGTAILRADVVSSDPAQNKLEVLGMKIFGSLKNYPREYTFRTGYVHLWGGQLSDGTHAPEGSYHFLVRALRIFGDPENVDDYDVVETVPIQIVYDKE